MTTKKGKYLGYYTKDIMIIIGFFIGFVYPLTFESYNYGVMYHWYSEAWVFSLIGWCFVLFGLLIGLMRWFSDEK